MNITKELSYIYKANQCTDLNDVENALLSLREMVKKNNMEYTPAMRRRLTSLIDKQEKLKNNGTIRFT